MQVAMYSDSMLFSWYNREGYVAGVETYNINVPQATKIYIKVDLYNPRMYAPGCKTA